jgi:hypothetical protein
MVHERVASHFTLVRVLFAFSIFISEYFIIIERTSSGFFFFLGFSRVAPKLKTPRSAPQVQASAPVQTVDSEITQKLRSYDFDVWSITDDGTFFSMVSGMFSDFGYV